MLLKKGAEADIYMTEWYGRKAVSKIRKPKRYRNKILDTEIRRKRTLHEAQMISAAKKAGVATPLIHFVDQKRTEIIMQHIEGQLVRDVLHRKINLSRLIGVYAARLHGKDIMHGDLTTSNFILHNNKLVLIDFGLSFYSDRIEDRATDVRLIKEIMSSAHAQVFNKAFDLFSKGYASVLGQQLASKIFAKVREIERRGRYARVV